MLPCQSTCPHYVPGCHKGCTQWVEFQAKERERRAAKKAYLQYYIPQCYQAIRQYRSLQPKRLAW